MRRRGARRGRESPVRPSPLHVTNGESAGNTLRQTTLGGAVLPWQDTLHEGPVPAGPRRNLLRTRAAFLSACGWGSRQAILASLDRRDRQLVQTLRDRQQVVLWFEHDLYDQLQLMDVLALASSSAADAAPELIIIGSFPGRPGFRGLAGLGTGDARLVETQDGRPLPAAPPLGDPHALARLPLRLTGSGQQVLEGQADRVALLGLDRWVGGTHLVPDRAWRWDPATQLLINPALDRASAAARHAASGQAAQ